MSAHACSSLQLCWRHSCPPADESLQPTKQAELAGVLSDWEARFATARVVAGTAGPYFLGPEPCLADIAVLPFLVRFDVLLQVR
jgi:glutathione S-transferase